MRMSCGWHSRRSSNTSSASLAVRTSYPSPTSKTFTSFRFNGLSSTIRIVSPVITAPSTNLLKKVELMRRQCPGLAQNIADFVQQFVRLLGFFRDRAGRGAKRRALLFSQVLARPNDDRRATAAPGFAEVLDTLKTIHLGHDEVENNGGGPFLGGGLKGAGAAGKANGAIAQLAGHFVGPAPGSFGIVDDHDGPG